MQTDENWIEIPNGFTSGDPARSGSFTQLFDQPGTFYFRSYVHTEVNTTACKRPFSLGCVAHMPCALCCSWSGEAPVHATACKRLFSLGCPHTDGACGHLERDARYG